MSIRSTLLLASAAIIGVSAPASAQDDNYSDIAIEREVVIEHGDMDHHTHGHASEHGHENHGEDRGEYDGEWQGEWVERDTYAGEWNGTYTQDGRHRRDPRHLGASPDGRLAYTLAEREAWLSDCRLLMADGGGFDDRRYRDDDDGGLIGGLLGAGVGGVVGNRIGGRGDRLAGTLIGAGVGGVAGAAIGSVIDSASRDRDGGEIDRNALWAAQYCDAYLRRYEMGGGSWGAQQVMVVPVATGSRHGHRHGDNCRTCRETVTEEWVEIERPAPRPRPRPTPRPDPSPQGKLTPLN